MVCSTTSLPVFVNSMLHATPSPIPRGSGGWDSSSRLVNASFEDTLCQHVIRYHCTHIQHLTNCRICHRYTPYFKETGVLRHTWPKFVIFLVFLPQKMPYDLIRGKWRAALLEGSGASNQGALRFVSCREVIKDSSTSKGTGSWIASTHDVLCTSFSSCV